MLIRYGYEITVTCAQPTPMVCLLSVSEDRKADLRVAEKVFTTPIVPTTTYVDTFSNRCLRLVAPPAISQSGETPQSKTTARSTRRTSPGSKSPSRSSPIAACSI